MSALKRIINQVMFAFGAFGLVGLGATVINEPGLRAWGSAFFFMAFLIVVWVVMGDDEPEQERG